MRNADFEMIDFTPAEVETITGLSTGMQRDWRYRGFIEPRGGGHARFDILEICAIFAMKKLADLGIGPQKSTLVRHILAEGIAWHILGFKESYDGDISDAAGLSSAPPARPDAAVDALLVEIGKRTGRDLSLQWNNDSVLLRKRFFKSLGKRAVLLPRVIPGHLLIWWPAGEPIFHSSYDVARADLKADDLRRFGPSVVLDMTDAAIEIARLAARAFIIVEIR